MYSVNKVFILGYVGNDPKGISFKDGSMLTNFSVATNKAWKDNQGNKKVDTQWHNISIRGRAADEALRNIRKGTLVYIEGSIKTKKYINSFNNTIYITEIQSNSFQNLSN